MYSDFPIFKDFDEYLELVGQNNTCSRRLFYTLRVCILIRNAKDGNTP
jgi:hypothetical protein